MVSAHYQASEFRGLGFDDWAQLLSFDTETVLYQRQYTLYHQLGGIKSGILNNPHVSEAVHSLYHQLGAVKSGMLNKPLC